MRHDILFGEVRGRLLAGKRFEFPDEVGLIVVTALNGYTRPIPSADRAINHIRLNHLEDLLKSHDAA